MLRGPHWLNDDLIAFYFFYIAHNVLKDNSDDFLLVPPAVTQLIKMCPDDAETTFESLHAGRKKIICFALNDNREAGAGGSHWSLVVFSRLENSFLSLDSCGDHNQAATIQLVKVLRVAFRCPAAPEVKVETLQQRNGHDCGIHVLANVENVCSYFLEQNRAATVPMLTDDVVRGKRAQILNIIEQLRAPKSGMFFIYFICCSHSQFHNFFRCSDQGKKSSENPGLDTDSLL